MGNVVSPRFFMVYLKLGNSSYSSSSSSDEEEEFFMLSELLSGFFSDELEDEAVPLEEAEGSLPLSFALPPQLAAPKTNAAARKKQVIFL
jgi:hypothetical protein